jgi:hemerythrin-like domain-containing protein
VPLGRHPALAPFSRDHHRALRLALSIQAGAPPQQRSQLPADVEGLVAHVQRVFTTDLEPHFMAEEAVLLPAVAGRDAELDLLVAAIVAEHREMASLVGELSRDGHLAPGVEAMLDGLGRLLEAHIRTEERSLYEKIQTVLDEEDLDRLVRELEHFVRVHADRVGAVNPG